MRVRVFQQWILLISGFFLLQTLSAARIISLAPDITEILFAIGAGDQVVGVVSASDYPARVKTLPVVGSYSGLDVEYILTLKPDLIVAWGGTFTRQLTILKNMGISIYTTSPQQLEDIPKTMAALGVLTHTSKHANQAILQFNHQLDQLKQQYQPVQPVTVFYQIGSYSLMTINHQSWINQVISLCGGRNVFASLKVSAPLISAEALVNADPEVIITDAQDAAWKTRWLHYPTLRAVKKNTIYQINPDLIERAGPRLVDGALKICEFLHQKA